MLWANASFDTHLTANACEPFRAHFNWSLIPNIFPVVDKSKRYTDRNLRFVNEPFQCQNSRIMKKTN